ncbi:MAG: hypothetical protein UMR38_03485 [Candidatus Izemoplasma sp.]|nr:hypothetical protein [Candidatus Izemoplasma sp.]
MDTYEIFRSKTLQPFKEWHHKLWQQFSNTLDTDIIYIFECVYLQNHINELMLKYNLPLPEHIAYFKALLEPLVSHDPILFFVEQKDVKKAIDHVSEERKSPDKAKFQDWIDRVIEYIRDMPYGKTLGYTDYEGIIQYFKDRQLLSKEIIKTLPITTYVYQLDGSYDEVFNQIKKTTLNTLK